LGWQARQGESLRERHCLGCAARNRRRERRIGDALDGAGQANVVAGGDQAHLDGDRDDSTLSARNDRYLVVSALLGARGADKPSFEVGNCPLERV